MQRTNDYLLCPAVVTYVLVKTTNIEGFGDDQQWALTLGDDGKLWTCLVERGGTMKVCEVCSYIGSQFSGERGRGDA